MSGLAFACVVVMPPRPNGRMFPPKMKMGVLSVMFACQQHDAAQIARLAIKEVPNLLQTCCQCPSQEFLCTFRERRTPEARCPRLRCCCQGPLRRMHTKDVLRRSCFCKCSLLTQRLQTRAHLDSDILGAAASIDRGVVVQVVPGSSGKVGLCGVSALVHNGRDQQRIACSTERLCITTCGDLSAFLSIQ